MPFLQMSEKIKSMTRHLKLSYISILTNLLRTVLYIYVYDICQSLFQQQDAAEILSCIFEEFCVESLHVQHMVKFNLRYEITSTHVSMTVLIKNPHHSCS